MLNRLNGWQRLWVVVTLFLGVSIAIKAAQEREFPTADEVRQSWKTIADRQVPSMTVSPELLGKCSAKGEGTENPYEGMLRCVEEHRVPPSEEDKEKHRKLLALADEEIRDSLLTRQIQFIAIPLGAWVITSALLYLAGLVVAWIVRGFRKA